MIKTKLVRLLLIICICPVVISSSFGAQDIQDLLDRIESSLKQRDIEAYLDNFAPEIREREELALREKFEQLNLDSVSVFRTQRQIRTENGIRTYLNVLFENLDAVVIEIWQLDLENLSNQWQIKEKGITRDVQNLYKIRIPSGREEIVSRVDIRHADIQITFHNPIVFYDNLPDIETALLVVGEGELRFTPSLPREKHQLELVYKKRYLQDRLNYVFVRCSNSLFEKNVRIERREGNSLPIGQSEKNRAYSLFTKHYSRSFTIENSLNGMLLSVIPQDEESVIEFEGKKIGKFTYIFSPFAEEEVTLYQWTEQRFLNIYSPQAEGEKRFFISFEEKFDVLRYVMDLDYEPDNKYISGRAEIEIESKSNNLDKVKLKLNPDLEILHITDDDNNELLFAKDRLRRNLYVYFIEPIPRNRVAKIKIYYRGMILPRHIEEDAISVGQIDDLLIYIPPRSETYFYSLNSQWYPVPPEGDYFTARIKIIIPPDFSVISNGVLVEESEVQQSDKVEELKKVGQKVCIFESQKPIKYMSFIVGKLQKKSEDRDPFPIKYFRTPGVILPRMDFLQESKKIVQFYESKFGPYPFESLSIIHRTWQESGGHSPASFIVLNQLPRIQGARLVRINNPVNLTRWHEYYLAHEIAHQWWGQGVTWERHHDQWISEGLAQFSTILYLKEKYGETAFESILKKMSEWTEKKAKWGPIIFGSRISHFDFYAFQTIVYNKSSLALNMLKDMLGEEVFFSGIREFFKKFKYRAARTNDFVVTLSEIYEKDLRPFFDAWFESFKLPVVKVTHDTERVADKYRLKFHISQQGDPFIFPLRLEWIEDGIIVRKMVVVDRKEVNIQFDLTHRPKRIQINPDYTVPGKFY
ncbi:MAG: hypothetical protein JSV17_01775 [Candidatus Aminicenantes bacterium]|nr:MAG: hypothetical protein JSV17_01775 [Candidatus Aminicenantes bacterium]